MARINSGSCVNNIKSNGIIDFLNMLSRIVQEYRKNLIRKFLDTRIISLPTESIYFLLSLFIDILTFFLPLYSREIRNLFNRVPSSLRLGFHHRSRFSFSVSQSIASTTTTVVAKHGTTAPGWKCLLLPRRRLLLCRRLTLLPPPSPPSDAPPFSIANPSLFLVSFFVCSDRFQTLPK